jgi:hypothetical protein
MLWKTLNKNVLPSSSKLRGSNIKPLFQNVKNTH